MYAEKCAVYLDARTSKLQNKEIMREKKNQETSR